MPPFEPDQFEPRGRRELVLSLLFIALSGVLIVLPSSAQEQVAGVFRGTVLAPFILLQESLTQARIRAVDTAELQERLDAATAALSAQRTLLNENQRLRELLDLRERAGPGFRSASVIRAGTRGSESMILLDVGRDDGVQVYDPVVSPEGLVGVVREVSSSTSVAMDWTHPDFRVSAMTLDGEAYGFVEARHGAFREEDRLLLDGIPYYTTLEEGTAVVTSGRGGVYPRGILVGAIQSLAEAEAGWRRGYWLVPAVRPAAVTHVLVMTAEASPSGEPRPGEEGMEAFWGIWADPPEDTLTPLLETDIPGALETIEEPDGVPEVDPDAHLDPDGPGQPDSSPDEDTGSGGGGIGP